MLPAQPHNLRDLGGLPTEEGLTQPGRIYRSGSPDQLQAREWMDLSKLGITTIVDLRNAYEIEPAGFMPGDIESVSCPVEDQTDADFMSAWGDRLGSPAYYPEIVMRWPELVASVFSAISEVATGAVLIHCSAGRDRTGMIVAMLLTLVGAERTAILDDYSAGVREHNVWLGRGDLRERARTSTELESAVRSSRAELNSFLDQLNVEGYLLGAGTSATQLARIRSRLLD